MLSTSLASPMRKPSRDPCRMCGDALMFSWPPAMTMSASPHLIACAARCVALSPLPHTLPTVMPGGVLTDTGGEHLPQDHFGNLLRLQLGPDQQRPYDLGSQLRRRHFADG